MASTSRNSGGGADSTSLANFVEQANMLLGNGPLAALVNNAAIGATMLGGADEVSTELPGAYQLGDGENLFLANLDSIDLASLGGALDGAEIAALAGEKVADALIEHVGGRGSVVSLPLPTRR